MILYTSKLSQNKTKQQYQAILLIFLVISLVSGSSSYGQSRCIYYITAGDKSLPNYSTARQMAAVSGETICAKESSGSLANIYNLLNNESVVAGFVQSDIVKAAARKKPEKFQTLKIVLPVKREMAHMVVRKDSAIKQFADMGNTVVCVGKKSSGSYFTALQLKANTHTPWVEAEEDFDQCIGLLERGSVDAVFVLATPPVVRLQGKIGQQFRLIDLPVIGGYQRGTISQYENAVTSSTHHTSTFSVDTVMLVHEDRVKSSSVRLHNKLALAVSDTIYKLPLQVKDDVCTRNLSRYGVETSFLNRQACKLGYFGDDW